MVTSPSGTITFLFTDIEGSTRRWDEQPEAMREALARHDAILRESIERHGGYVFKTVGDGFCAVFATAPAAVAAAADAQRALTAEPSGDGMPGAVRMALHTGAADERDGDYFGPPLNRAERLRAAAHGGQIVLSAVTAALLQTNIPDGVELRYLGVYRLRGLSEPERVYQAAVWGLPADFPPLALVEARPSSLPVPVTRLVGREQDIEQVVSLLGTTRLLTLTGLGGVGKTRLAIAIAERVHGEYADGAIFIDLSALSDPGLVASTIAQTLGVRENEGRTLIESLQSFLREKRLPLVLDNFEQVVEAAPVVGDLLASCSDLTVLVTSRMPLRLRGEHDYPIHPLALPDPTDAPPTAELSRYAAVALFIQRAREAKPEFVFTTANAATVVDICRSVDGLPLAIELAAARVRVLPPPALLARLAHRLALLTGGARDLPSRQQSLRATTQWSYDLLTRDEQRLFRRLAVFVGGWTVEAAEAVCIAGEDAGRGLLDHLTLLVDTSLVLQREGADGEPRFTMLETIREYALEQLRAHDEPWLLQQRHAAYFLALAERAEPLYRSGAGRAWDQRLNAERDNLRAALRWNAGQDDPEPGLRLVGALQLWLYRHMVSEGRRWAEDFLARSATTRRTVGRAKALLAAAVLAWVQADYHAGARRAGESAALWRSLSDRHEMFWAQSWLVGMYAGHRAGRRVYARVYALGVECVVHHRKAGDRWHVAVALLGFGIFMSIRGDPAEARPLLEESAALFRALGDGWWGGAALLTLGSLALNHRDVRAARAFLEEALSLSREAGDKRNTAMCLDRLGRILQWEGEHPRAEALLREGLVLEQEVGLTEGIASCLDGLALAAHARGSDEAAARLCAATVELRMMTGARADRSLRDRTGQLVAALREALGEEGFAAASAAGRVLSLDAAVALALEQVEEPPAQP